MGGEGRGAKDGKGRQRRGRAGGWDCVPPGLRGEQGVGGEGLQHSQAQCRCHILYYSLKRSLASATCSYIAAVLNPQPCRHPKKLMLSSYNNPCYHPSPYPPQLTRINVDALHISYTKLCVALKPQSACTTMEQLCGNQLCTYAGECCLLIPKRWAGVGQRWAGARKRWAGAGKRLGGGRGGWGGSKYVLVKGPAARGGR